MADEKEQVKESNELMHSEFSASSVGSSLAGMVLEDSIRKGRVVEIPSLGIRIGKENLRKPNHNGSRDNLDSDEHDKDTISVSS